jgi:hypothetical protein
VRRFIYGYEGVREAFKKLKEEWYAPKLFEEVEGRECIIVSEILTKSIRQI